MGSWLIAAHMPARRQVRAAVLLLTASAVACMPPHREAWETAPLPQNGVEVTRLKDGRPLSIDRVRFWFSELGETRFFLALVPVGVGPVADVLVLNHGWADRPEDLLRELQIAEVYTAMLEAGEVRPAVIVLPDIRFSIYFRRHSAEFPFGQSLPLVAEDTAGLVSKTYGIPQHAEHWGVAGFSFGGYVALDVARRYGGRFGSASVVSGFFDEEWSFWPPTPPPPGRLDSRGRGKQTVVAPGRVPRLFLACGTDDRLYKAMAKLHDRLAADRIPHEWRTSPGGHTWQYWSSVLKPMLRFHLGIGTEGRVLSDPSASGPSRLEEGKGGAG